LLAEKPLEEMMKRFVLAFLLSSFTLSGAVADPTCHDKAADKKLSGAAKTNFTNKCVKDAAVT